MRDRRRAGKCRGRTSSGASQANTDAALGTDDGYDIDAGIDTDTDKDTDTDTDTDSERRCGHGTPKCDADAGQEYNARIRSTDTKARIDMAMRYRTGKLNMDTIFRYRVTQTVSDQSRGVRGLQTHSASASN